jgi:hypothetical protein
MWEGELFVRCGGLASDCASGIGLSGVEISVERNVGIEVSSWPIRNRVEVDIRAGTLSRFAAAGAGTPEIWT